MSHFNATLFVRSEFRMIFTTQQFRIGALNLIPVKHVSKQYVFRPSPLNSPSSRWHLPAAPGSPASDPTALHTPVGFDPEDPQDPRCSTPTRPEQQQGGREGQKRHWSHQETHVGESECTPNRRKLFQDSSLSRWRPGFDSRCGNTCLGASDAMQVAHYKLTIIISSSK